MMQEVMIISNSEMRIRTATFRHIEAELYSYKYTKQEIRNLREQIMHSADGKHCLPGASSIRTPSDSTAERATRLATDKRLNNLEEIIRAIDSTYAELSPDHQRVIELRYWSNKRYTWEGIALELNMHRNTATKYRREFIKSVAYKIGWR